MKTEKLCIYHGDCFDGFTAAWVIWKRFNGDVRFHKGVYGQEPPLELCTNRDVFLLDFCYKPDDVEKILGVCQQLQIIDHHKTAHDEMFALRAKLQEEKKMLEFSRFFFEYDVYSSGAGLAWNWFFQNQAAPMNLLHIQDRDLWQFKLQGTREIHAAMGSYHFEFKIWDELMNRNAASLISEGECILRKQKIDINLLISKATRKMGIHGWTVPVTNAPFFLGSELCAITCQGEPFSAYYYDSPLYREFGLRSDDQGIDVGEIAQVFGGGGHKHASGFRLSFEKAKQFEL